MSFTNMISNNLISNSVGNNLVNDEDDVRRVKDGLNTLGLFDNDTAPEPHGYITRPMDEGIKTFQKRENLRIDGRLFPEGETENTMLNRLSTTEGTQEENVPIPPRKPEAPNEPEPPIPPRKPSPPKEGGHDNKEECERGQSTIRKVEGELVLLKKVHTEHRERIALAEVQREEAEASFNEVQGRKIISHAPSLAWSLSETDSDESSLFAQILETNVNIARDPEVVVQNNRLKEIEGRLQNLKEDLEKIEESITAKEQELNMLQEIVGNICT